MRGRLRRDSPGGMAKVGGSAAWQWLVQPRAKRTELVIQRVGSEQVNLRANSWLAVLVVVYPACWRLGPSLADKVAKRVVVKLLRVVQCR